MGPIAMIYLREQLSNDQLREMWDIIERLSDRVHKSDIYNLEFSISDVRALGGLRFGESGSFGLLIYSPADSDTPEAAIAIKESFGFEPQQVLQFDSMCNSRDEHFLMGTLLCHFAGLYQGIVDFNGALLPPLPEELYSEEDWSKIKPYFDEMVKTLDGRVVGVEYDGGGTWVFHIGDATFMKSWLHHPGFHLIK